MKPSKSPVSSIPEGVTEEAVRPQLTRILSSASFRDSPQLSSFLSFIVESTLSGQAYRIKQYTIAIDALNYSKDFDPQTNTAVRVLGSRLRELLTLYYLQEGANDELRIEIPRRTYIPVFQPNLMLHAPPDQSKVPLSVVPAAMEDYGLSIAVIPFSNTGKNSRSHADSITELIVTGLIQFRELHIIGPIDEYKNCVVKTDEIAQRYHARFILQGRVEMLEGTFRISAGLTDTRSGFKIWSQNYTYDKDSLSLFKGEEDLSRQIVSAIANYIGVIPCLIGQESIKKNRYSLESYEAIYILSRFLRVLTKTALHDAVEALEFAMKTEPENPIVLATLSHACCINYLFDMGLDDLSLEKADRLVRHSIAIDPGCQLALISDAFTRFHLRQADQCIAKLRFINSLKPFDAFIINSSGVLLCMLGHWKEGKNLCKQAIHMNPHQPPMYSIIFFMDCYRHGDYERAWNYAASFDAPLFWAPMCRAATAGQMGLQTQARIDLKELLESRPDFPSRARDLLRRLAYLDEHVDMLLDGLLKAGLKLTPA